jgi:hypothetical protein
MIATTIATVAYSWPSLNTAGTRCIIRSLVTPPPIAVIVPSSTAGSHSSPTSSVLSAPAVAQSEIAAASTRTNTRLQALLLTCMRKAIAAPASAVGM